jgi:hypothetical protein
LTLHTGSAHNHHLNSYPDRTVDLEGPVVVTRGGLHAERVAGPRPDRRHVRLSRPITDHLKGRDPEVAAGIGVQGRRAGLARGLPFLDDRHEPPDLRVLRPVAGAGRVDRGDGEATHSR